MENGNISASQISASSQWNSDLAPHQARLRNGKCWAAGAADSSQWLQVDLGSTMRVVGIATQGRLSGKGQWVTQYKLQYREDGQAFKFYRQNGDSSATVRSSFALILLD